MISKYALVCNADVPVPLDSFYIAFLDAPKGDIAL
ncbi:hypothetical protein DESC_780140 [Desulfosarcina cetonica]|nr:hypothetical protein DESC_780140 [Desulfosarcina cetonica]